MKSFKFLSPFLLSLSLSLNPSRAMGSGNWFQKEFGPTIVPIGSTVVVCAAFYKAYKKLMPDSVAMENPQQVMEAIFGPASTVASTKSLLACDAVRC